MELTKSLSTRTLCELPEEYPVIDLRDCDTLLQFAHSIRNLTCARRQTIWIQNVKTNDTLPSQTTDPQQTHDILLFLVIIYGKEKFPTEEDLLIAKLKVFVTSSPFIRLKTYIQRKYFPIFQDQFVNNSSYFASMIEDYATHSLRPQWDKRATSVPLTMSHAPNPTTPASTSSTAHSEDAFYARLEQKIVNLFSQRLSQMEYKMNNLSKEIQLMKYAMIEEAKLEDDTDRVDDLMTEIQSMKRDIATLRLEKKSPKKSKKRSKKKARKESTDEFLSIKSENQTNSDIEAVISEEETSTETSPDMERHKEELREWLDTECGLSEYLDLFISNGLDDLSMMPHITMSDLAWLGVENLGHRVKIMQKVQQLKYEKQRQ